MSRKLPALRKKENIMANLILVKGAKQRLEVDENRSLQIVTEEVFIDPVRITNGKWRVDGFGAGRPVNPSIVKYLNLNSRPFE